jgi:hypothetical protein
MILVLHAWSLQNMRSLMYDELTAAVLQYCCASTVQAGEEE